MGFLKGVGSYIRWKAEKIEGTEPRLKSSELSPSIEARRFLGIPPGVKSSSGWVSSFAPYKEGPISIHDVDFDGLHTLSLRTDTKRINKGKLAQKIKERLAKKVLEGEKVTRGLKTMVKLSCEAELLARAEPRTRLEEVTFNSKSMEMRSFTKSEAVVGLFDRTYGVTTRRMTLSSIVIRESEEIELETLLDETHPFFGVAMEDVNATDVIAREFLNWLFISILLGDLDGRIVVRDDVNIAFAVGDSVHFNLGRKVSIQGKCDQGNGEIKSVFMDGGRIEKMSVFMSIGEHVYSFTIDMWGALTMVKNAFSYSENCDFDSIVPMRSLTFDVIDEVIDELCKVFALERTAKSWQAVLDKHKKAIEGSL